MAALADMRASAAFSQSVFFLACLALMFALLAARGSAQSPSPTAKPAVFRIKYLSEQSVYIDAGRNAALAEGMKLSVIAAPPDGVAADGVRFRGYPHIAELNVISVADSSAVCDVISST